ncbi:PRC-barrel domain-containing protein [Synechococcus sp. PCC 6312]|uniref:PRC-barrel domain-containing protein n=1 Tax=Synechococcus sp. (strain ATCC 27167 / PCC 6312) TaxID=195253 RepID=UPI00029EF6A5|nr:PRC-barrel domain-containing protein [Synechococcus sp. PCC 6312]AFY61747.1 hypothetical protein Syn6312_2653 [Synechococcus sp. PCC 6312]
MTISEQFLQRGDLIGTQVITRDSGRKLGVINQVWVDIDQRSVVALGMRNTLFTGEQRYIYLDSIRQIGDVVLVDTEDSLEPVNVFNYSTLIDSEVITETGELLGKVRGFKFEVETGKVTDLVIASFGLPWIPSQLISTYELPIDEIVSTGPDRLIVFEGAESRLNQLTVGLLERVGLGAPPWEQEEDEYIQPMTPTSNQLPAGSRTPVYPPERRYDAPRRRTYEPEPEYEYREPRPAKAPQYYEEDNWDETPPARPLSRPNYQATPETRAYQEPTIEYDDDLEQDPWRNQEDEPYKAPRVNIPSPEKVKKKETEPEY